MKLFHWCTEGGRVKPGFNISRYKNGKWFAFSVGISRRVFALFDWDYLRFWLALDWSRDHKMYRPNDMDGGLICRRCEQYFSNATSQCSGSSKKWGWSPQLPEWVQKRAIRRMHA